MHQRYVHVLPTECSAVLGLDCRTWATACQLLLHARFILLPAARPSQNSAGCDTAQAPSGLQGVAPAVAGQCRPMVGPQAGQQLGSEDALTLASAAALLKHWRVYALSPANGGGETGIVRPDDRATRGSRRRHSGRPVLSGGSKLAFQTTEVGGAPAAQDALLHVERISAALADRVSSTASRVSVLAWWGSSCGLQGPEDGPAVDGISLICGPLPGLGADDTFPADPRTGIPQEIPQFSMVAGRGIARRGATDTLAHPSGRPADRRTSTTPPSAPVAGIASRDSGDGSDIAVWANICQSLCIQLAGLADARTVPEDAMVAASVQPSVLRAAAAAFEAACTRLLGMQEGHSCCLSSRPATTQPASPSVTSLAPQGGQTCFECPASLSGVTVSPALPRTRGFSGVRPAGPEWEGLLAGAGQRQVIAGSAWLPMDEWGSVPMLQLEGTWLCHVRPSGSPAAMSQHHTL